MTERSELPLAATWFALGERVPASPEAGAPLIFRCFEGEGAHVVTFLGGFPDGSYGWSRVLPFLPAPEELPRLFIEYVGQGDSDKPKQYAYGGMERADTVEAQWRDLGVQSTTIVTFDFSSLVAMELLRREQGRSHPSQGAKIDGVLFINGGLFRDGHSHPVLTTPLLKTPLGRVGTWFAQRSRFIFAQMMKVLWSKEYDVSKEEIDQLFDVVTRRNGASFLSAAAGFVDEHKSQRTRWDFKKIYVELRDTHRFLVVGSEKDPFEYRQIKKARKRLRKHGLDVRTLPGGHLTTSEHPDKLGAIIAEFSLPAGPDQTEVHHQS